MSKKILLKFLNKSSLSKDDKFSVIKNVFEEIKKESRNNLEALSSNRKRKKPETSTDEPIHLTIPKVEPGFHEHQKPTVDSEIYQCALNLFAFKNNLYLKTQLPPSLENRGLVLRFTVETVQ